MRFQAWRLTKKELVVAVEIEITHKGLFVDTRMNREPRLVDDGSTLVESSTVLEATYKYFNNLSRTDAECSVNIRATKVFRALTTMNVIEYITGNAEVIGDNELVVLTTC